MIIIRDEKKMARFRTFAQITSFAGMALLLGGMVLVFVGDPQDVFVWQLVALLGGWLLSQIGIYLANRYLRSPRPDEAIDEALGKVAKDGRLYHYILPAPHVLLTPAGIILFVAKFQGGKIRVENDKWQQSGLGMRRFFGQENLGNPTRDAQLHVDVMVNFLKKHAPEVAEISMAPIIVFTSKGVHDLELAGSSVPAMHVTKLKGFLKQQKQQKMASADYEKIRAAFDGRIPAGLAATAVGDTE